MLKGRKLSEEHKRKLSLAHIGKRGRKHSEETKQKMSKSMRGKKHKPLSKEARKKIGLHHKGKIVSTITKQRMSESAKGKIKSIEHRRKLSEALKGRKLTEQHTKNMSISRKGKKLKPLTKTHKRKISNTLRGRKFSNKTRRKMSLSRQGNKNPSWKGGITPIRILIRESSKYEEWKQKVLIRDKFICQKCGKTGMLHAHHKKSFSKLLQEIKHNLPLLSLYEGAMIYKPLWDIKNGITLCIECHSKMKKHHLQI